MSSLYTWYAVQERCRALMRTKPTLGELVKLDADAEELPGIIPEMDALNRCPPDPVCTLSTSLKRPSGFMQQCVHGEAPECCHVCFPMPRWLCIMGLNTLRP